MKIVISKKFLMYDKNIKYKIIILTRILSGMFYIHLTTIN